MGPYAQAKAAYPQIDREVLKTLSEIVGIPPEVLVYWQLDPAIGGATVFLTSLLLSDGVALGIYDGRVTAVDTGIAGSVDPNSGGNDPTITAEVRRVVVAQKGVSVRTPANIRAVYSAWAAAAPSGVKSRVGCCTRQPPLAGRRW